MDKLVCVFQSESLYSERTDDGFGIIFKGCDIRGSKNKKILELRSSIHIFIRGILLISCLRY